MTFDDGIVGIYRLVNTAENGLKPKYQLALKERYYFGFDVLGISRYYTALQAKVQLSHVINIPGWGEVDPTDIAVLENGEQFRLPLIQKQLDDNNLRITKLSLERITQEYELSD